MNKVLSDGGILVLRCLSSSQREGDSRGLARLELLTCPACRRCDEDDVAQRCGPRREVVARPQPGRLNVEEREHQGRQRGCRQPATPEGPISPQWGEPDEVLRRERFVP